MFGYKMIQMVRAHAYKLDAPLREHLIHTYKPFKRTPCFLHSTLEKLLNKTKRVEVVIEFKQDCYDLGYEELCSIVSSKRRCKNRHQFPKISCCSATLTPEAIGMLAAQCSHVKKVYLNREVKAFLDTAIPAANAGSVTRDEIALTGKGVTIAIIDTGVEEHQDLEGRIIDFADFIDNRNTPYDDNGHGTHVAGCAAGDGRASNGRYKAPAPESRIIGVKVLNKGGAGSLETVMRGIQWCIDYNENNQDQPIHIMNLSLGSASPRYDDESEDPMVKMVQAAWKEGIVVVAAAGNEGPNSQTIGTPGLSSDIITVGALDNRNTEDRSDDMIASFSSRGPTIYGETKPDIVAPGVSITSLRAPNSFIDKLQKLNRVGSHYFTMSGTSMAAPICAGVIALMLENDPSLSPSQVKKQLMEGPVLWTDRDPNIYGAGYINARNSIDQP
ncbi:S8 family peptidase [Bacillus sp. FJAT-44742]|uniref:S8 family peptidase n=1 Tax=Bacillus sp. FJAT-44742 TaxID=2014005 RepID=UPI000C239959|nr:S8 family peptidase [Bacillus sp. FJAT-44742]